MSASRTTYLDLMIGPHKVIRKLGEGGMGSVWEAVNVSLGRHVAVKFLRPEYARDEVHLRRFFNEARAANAIDHPGIVQIFDTGMLDADTPYLLMELLRGQPLDVGLEKERNGMIQQEALSIAWQAADVLVALHARGIVHRDLKPGNIMTIKDPLAMGGIRVKILDLGLAKLRPEQQGGAAATRAGSIMGTPIYMAPEQCLDSTTVTGRADVYALGIVLFELLAGQPPFLTANHTDILRMHLFAEVPDLRKLAPHVSVPVAELTREMLRKEQSQRPSMEQVRDRLAILIEGEEKAAAQSIEIAETADTVRVRKEATDWQCIDQTADTETDATPVFPVHATMPMLRRGKLRVSAMTAELTCAFQRLTPFPLAAPLGMPRRSESRITDAVGILLCILGCLLPSG